VSHNLTVYLKAQSEGVKDIAYIALHSTTWFNGNNIVFSNTVYFYFSYDLQNYV